MTTTLDGPRPSPPAFPAIRMGEVDRFLVPFEEDDITRWFLEHLFVAHNLRERMAGAAAGGRGRRWIGRTLFDRCWTLEPPLNGGPDSLRSVDSGAWGRILSRIGTAFAHPDGPFETPPDPGRCIFLRDYRGSRRGNVLVFVFGPREGRPHSVVKVRAAAAGRDPLRAEWTSLGLLHARLPRDLSTRIPGPVAFRSTAQLDMLVVSRVSGRSAYIDLYRDLRPRRFVRAHLTAALDWLVAFQEATRLPGREYRPEEDRTLRPRAAEREPATWYDKLLEGCARSAPQLCAVHGDFWARNLLLRRNRSDRRPRPTGARVVDWECFAAEGPPFADLFHFALSYGLDFPWSGYRRRPPVEAFRLGFLEENTVSREIRTFLLTYCTRTGMDPWLLAPFAHVHLLERAVRDPEGPWLQCHRALERAGRSVLTP